MLLHIPASADSPTTTKSLSADKGLLKEFQLILDQGLALLKWGYYEERKEDTLLTAFRLLVEEVLVIYLYESLNQGITNVLDY
ncbi:hypothetical protein CJU90_4135 [Yarrowia sp. C11]|nr:hypothetical protein CJU90_4135 [Yarrowia sp. C11]